MATLLSPLFQASLAALFTAEVLSSTTSLPPMTSSLPVAAESGGGGSRLVQPRLLRFEADWPILIVVQGCA